MKMLVPVVVTALLSLPGWTQSAGQAVAVSAASRQPEVAPASLALVIGEGFVEEAVAIEPWQTAAPPAELNGISVRLNGLPAGIIHVTPSEIYFVLPEGLEPGEAELAVLRGGTELVARGKAVIVPLSPGLFSEDNTGRGTGRIYNAATGEPGPFRCRTRLESGFYPTRLILAATGLRRSASSGAGGPTMAEEAVSVTFLNTDPAGRTQEWIVEPDAIEPAAEYAGVDHVVVALPSELNGLNEVFVAVRAGGKQSNWVSLNVLMEEAPVITSVEPLRVAPGQVLRVTGKGFAGSVDGRDRIKLSADEKLLAYAIPFRSHIRGAGVSEEQTLEIITPPLLESLQSPWFEGQVRVCVETDGISQCAPNPIEMIKPPTPAMPPGDVLLTHLEETYETLIKSVAKSDPQYGEKIRAAKDRARADLRARIDAALAGVPERIELTLPDGQRIESVFDLSAIQKLEAIIDSAGVELDQALPAEQLFLHGAARDAVDWDQEREIKEARFTHQLFQKTAENTAKIHLTLAAPALAACLLSAGAACLPLASVMSIISPALATASLMSTAGMISIELGPNTLQELRVSPSYLELRPGESSSFDVRGRFGRQFEATQDLLEKAAGVVLLRTISNVLGLGPTGYLAEKTITPAAGNLVAQALTPVVGWIVKQMMDLGLADFVTMPKASSRDVGLSWETVTSTCIRGSSPSPGVPFFLGSWEVKALRGMAAPQHCQFAAKEGAVLMLPEAKTPVSAAIFVPGKTGCAPSFVLGTDPLFGKITQIVGPNSSGDSLVLGFSGLSVQAWFNLRTARPVTPNELFCERLTLTPGCTAEVYVPNEKEANGDFSGWSQLFNPLDDRVPLPGNMIPAPWMGPAPNGVLALRVKSLQGCGK